mmetsp:Transcript_33878/g.75130  ORF Transcript_33878/g.75130 Transcript_33878/m.75130 type:complete len:411 (-) Transcript_33878:1543-2775(-)
MALETLFAGHDDSLFSNLPSLPEDLDDLFSDDLAQFLRTEELVLVDTSVVLPVEERFHSEVTAPVPQISGPNSHVSSSLNCPAQSSAPRELAVQRCAGPPTKANRRRAAGLVRLVTTELPSPSSPVPEPAPAPSPAPVVEVKKEVVVEAPVASHHGSDNMGDTDSEDSNFTEEDAMNIDDGPQQAGKVNKRKAPEVDWRAIEDPAERRRQRRLAKNRVTAARSRERKKVQWADMEIKLNAIHSENQELKAMLEKLARENSLLRDQLAGLAQGAAPTGLRGNSYSAEPAVLVFISTMLLLCCVLPADKAVLLGSGVPLLLLAQLVSGKADQPLSDALLRFLLTIKTLLARSAKKLRDAVHKVLYRRQYCVGRRVLSSTHAWACQTPGGMCQLSQQYQDLHSKAHAARVIVS